MTAPDLSAIRAQLAGITPGEWYADVMGNHSADVFATHEDGALVICEHAGSDAAFIAAAPSTVARLLGIMERVEAEVAATEELAEIVMGEDLQAGLRLVARGIRAAIAGEGGA